MRHPHFTITAPFMRMFHLGVLVKSLHPGDTGEAPAGPIVEHGEFAGPVDGWLPTHTWLERHSVGEAVTR